MRYGLIGLIFGVLLLLVSGCAGTTQLAEREIVRAAPRYIGPADRYEADVQGLQASNAEQVRVTGYGVRPVPDIVLRQLVLTFRDVDYQRQPFLVTRIGSADFSAQITDDAVNRYLTSQIAQRTTQLRLSDVRVSFLSNEVRVAGIATVGGQALQVTTTGTLQPQGSLVLYQPRAITVGNTALTQEIGTAVSSYVNPLFDLARLPFTPQLRTITLAPGVATLTGTGDPRQFIDTR